MVTALLLRTYRSIINKLVEGYMKVNHEYVTLDEYLEGEGCTPDEILLIKEITAPDGESTGEEVNAD